MSVSYNSFCESYCEPNWRSITGTIEFDSVGAHELHPDPDESGSDVVLGPYFVDQDDYGCFEFHGPELFFLGPRELGARPGSGACHCLRAYMCAP